MNFSKRLASSLLKNRFVNRLVERRFKWSIGIYVGNSPVNLTAPQQIRNPVLTAKDVTDVPAEFFADPFVVWENGTWYMFFEVLNNLTVKGDIGLATSQDGFDWTYQQIVLDEPFHLSYPYVFKWGNEYYMIPESCQAHAVNLYIADNFPTQWSLKKTLIPDRKFADSSIFYFNDRWWLFTAAATGDILYLYYAQELMGDWIEHPASPIVDGDNRIARPAGRVTILKDKIIRYTQDVRYIYGNQVRAFEITELTPTNYREREIKENPIIQASGSGWNKYGMHHIDPHQLAEQKWIACVDGNQTFFVLAF
jgi:hypothetical protein